MHGRALSKSFLVYKRIMDGNMANHCSARSKGNLRPCQIVDIEFELLDVEMTLSLWQRFWLKEPARRHLCVNTFCRRIGCPRWVLRIGSNYCESICPDCRNSLHRIQYQPRRSQKRIKYCEKRERLHRVHPNRMSLRSAAAPHAILGSTLINQNTEKV